MNEELKNKFGENAWYTSIVIRGKNGTNNTITVDQTDDPNSLKQEQFSYSNGFWEKKTDISLRIDGGQPQDYMFQLDKEVSIEKLYALMEESLATLEKEEGVSDAHVSFTSIKSSNEMTRKVDGIIYTISLYSNGENKSYSFVYNLNGELKSFNK